MFLVIYIHSEWPLLAEHFFMITRGRYNLQNFVSHKTSVNYRGDKSNFRKLRV